MMHLNNVKSNQPKVGCPIILVRSRNMRKSSEIFHGPVFWGFFFRKPMTTVGHTLGENPYTDNVIDRDWPEMVWAQNDQVDHIASMMLKVFKTPTEAIQSGSCGGWSLPQSLELPQHHPLATKHADWNELSFYALIFHCMFDSHMVQLECFAACDGCRGLIYLPYASQFMAMEHFTLIISHWNPM